jgi:ABC-2 type transport system permease protein
MNLRRIGADVSIFAKGYIRNPIALFFSFAFPVILIVMFGAIYSGSAGNVTLYTENLDHGSNVSEQFLSALDSSNVVSVSQVNATTVGSAGFAAWLAQNGHTVGLVIPDGFAQSFAAGQPVNLTVYTDPQDAADGGIAIGAVNGAANAFNLEAAHGKPIVGLAQANVGAQVYKNIDYLVPGLIGFTILTSPMFAIVEISSSYRKENIFRQLSLTPLTKGEWLTAKIVWYVIITFLTAFVMLAVGALAFGAHVTFTLEVVPFLVLGPLFFVALGMLSASVAKTPESASVVGNIITFPMMFLSGTFFPVTDFSAPLQLVAHVLPLYYVIDGMNQAMLFHNYGAPFLTDLAVIVVLCIVVAGLAVALFKWRDE